MSASITLAGEGQIARKLGEKKPLVIRKFIFAKVDGLDPLMPVDRAAGLPPADQIVHVYDIPEENAGYVNPNEVVYSAQLGSDIGDWDFNWVGLEDSDGLLFAVSYVPLQQKRRNIPPAQIGNNITRNFLVSFDGAMALTGVTIDASTWQHDFTVRLRDIDERERIANRDTFGRACFFGGGFKLSVVASKYQLAGGVAYIEGIRVQQAAQFVTPPAIPAKAWLDVSLGRQGSSVAAVAAVRWAPEMDDYSDPAGTRHYVVPLADIQNPTTLRDLRKVEPVSGPLIEHFARYNGDYVELRARATTKGDVGLGRVPNAISDDPATNSSDIIASTAALNRLNSQISDALTGMVAAFDLDGPPPGWLKRNGANVSRITYARLFAAIGTRYGAGDGVTTFNIGDSRGLFIRGLDDGRGVDPNRYRGSEQAGQNLAHSHVAEVSVAGGHVHGGSVGVGGAHSHSYSGTTHFNGNHNHAVQLYGPFAGSNGPSAYNSAGVGPVGRTETAGEHAHNFSGWTDAGGNHFHALSIHGAGDHAHSVTIHHSGGNELRPGNNAFLICVKY